MKNAAHNRVSRLLPLVVLVGLAFPASPVSAGVNVWTTNGPAGEVILALAIDPSSPATLYAATAIWPLGGVFKSTNRGGSWTLPSTRMTYLDVVALAIDPSTPATLYAGTDSFDYGASAFKRTDGGTNWTEMPAGAFALAIDPSTPRTLYAGTGDVFKSTDGGASWTALNAGVINNWVSVLAIDPSAPRTIYAGTGNLGLFKSTNGGESWSPINAGLTNPYVRALAIDPANSATLYAGTGDGVFKSTDGGESWAAINAGLTNSHVYVQALAIDPANSATLYAGTSGGGVFKSTDGGGSWTAMNAGLTNLGVNALAIDPSTPTRIYAGTFGGVFEYLTVEVLDRRIFPVVGSTPGAHGTFFRTSVQLHNSSTAPATGRILFHPSGASGSDSDPALSYSLAPGQTQSIADLLPEMGVSGIGSADIEVTSGAAPVATARVFNDAGPSGTTGFTEVAMRAEEALQSGQTGVLLAPPDFTVARFNLGLRTLGEGASMTLMLRSAAGAVVGSRTRSFPSNYHEQQQATAFLGVFEVPPGGSIEMLVASGAAIFYGATVDNRTGDPSLQIARATP